MPYFRTSLGARPSKYQCRCFRTSASTWLKVSTAAVLQDLVRHVALSRPPLFQDLIWHVIKWPFLWPRFEKPDLSKRRGKKRINYRLMALLHGGFGGTRRISKGGRKRQQASLFRKGSECIYKAACQYKGKIRSGLGNLGAGLPAHVGSSFFLVIWGAHSEPASTSTPSTGCPLFLSCGWTSTPS